MDRKEHNRYAKKVNKKVRNAKAEKELTFWGKFSRRVLLGAGLFVALGIVVFAVLMIIRAVN
ncbi:hypothetical protein [[Acholeplasma] multilocale]|uniref:hypothetical protein n=1 Tax=[Acholeplasma] multilocale TaxID=264638 RepID=UPI00047AB531|nr:hypothetical protein [[Acholeplasma] multilocale]